MEQNELGTVTLYLDNDETIECQILCVLDVNKQQYIALLPPDEEGGEESRSEESGQEGRPQGPEESREKSGP